jgi:hypothetical protein
MGSILRVFCHFVFNKLPIYQCVQLEIGMLLQLEKANVEC